MRSPKYQYPSNGKLSKSRQRQYIALHCLSILGEHVRTCKPHISAKTLAALKRIESRRVNLLNAHFGDVADKSRILVVKRFLAAMDRFDADGQIRPEDHINACLWMVETLREQGAKPIMEWDYLAQSLGTLYSHLDKELSDQAAMDQGEQVGKAIFGEFN